MGEHSLLLARQIYFEALMLYTEEARQSVNLLTLTPDSVFDPEAVAAQLRREAEALERLREVRRLYAKELSEWEEKTAQRAIAA